MLKLARVLPLTVALAVFMFLAPGCATVAAYLPTVIAAVQDGALVVDTIERFVDRYFEAKPNPEKQKQADQAIARTRSALDLALRTASGAQDLNDAKVDEAFAEFRRAYTDLVVLLGPLGLATGEGLRASPGGLTVPTPLAMAPVRR